MFNAWSQIFKRDLLIAFRRRSEIIHPLIFFVMVVSLFPLAIGDDKVLLQKIAPAIIWVTALLATMLSLDNLFRSDFEDGSLEQMTLLQTPLSFLITAKIVAHWVITGLPLIIITPLLAVLLYLPSELISTLLLTLLLGTPTLSLIGAVGIALTVGLRQGGVILSLLILPLYIPVLIFATLALQNVEQGFSAEAQLAMMLAILVLAITLSPFAIAAALKVSLN
ncbi:MAG: heme exporter protein CcmB [Gammaproteobacteria bacterium]|nr:heme exporter protein CcmB [Gammaproteobacteria bacterium]MDH5659361.1 heme exporter protein CcmB [Gammaproteobacteria bacterium]